MVYSAASADPMSNVTATHKQADLPDIPSPRIRRTKDLARFNRSAAAKE